MYAHADLQSAGPLRQPHDGQLTEISAQKAHWDPRRSLLSETLSIGNNTGQGSAKGMCEEAANVCVCAFLNGAEFTNKVEFLFREIIGRNVK